MLLDMETVLQTLTIMGQGMAGIMVVILLITLIVLLISKLDSIGEKKKEEE